MENLALLHQKSVLHRYIIASSLAKGISKIENISFSEDIIATIEAMKKLGAKIEQKENYLLIDGSDTFKIWMKISKLIAMNQVQL